MNDDMNSYLAHYGIQGMKWGVRRFQNPDGTLTSAGRERYGVGIEQVKKALGRAGDITKNNGKKAVAVIKKAAKQKAESEKARRKPVSAMSDQELRDTFNRLNMERSLKQVQAELNGANKQKRSFGQKHPVVQQIAITTAVGVASSLVSNQLRTKADEVLAPKRMERAKQKGMLNKDLFPFVYNNGGRITAYNNSEKVKADAEAAFKARVDEAIKEAKARNPKTFKVSNVHTSSVANKEGIKIAWSGLEKSFKQMPVNNLKPDKTVTSSYMLDLIRNASRGG
jgi:hypothetical protein